MLDKQKPIYGNLSSGSKSAVPKKDFAALKSSVKQMQQMIGELSADIARLRESASSQSDKESKTDSSMQSSLSNLESQRSGNVYIDQTNRSMFERVKQERLDSVKKQLANKESDLGGSSSPSDYGQSSGVQSSNNITPQRQQQIDQNPSSKSVMDAFKDSEENMFPQDNFVSDSQDHNEIQDNVLESNVKSHGGEIMGQSNTQISQFQGESNMSGLSKEFGINGDCGICSLVSAARGLGAVQGDEHSASQDITKVRQLVKPGSSHFEGTEIGDIKRGAERLGLKAEVKRANSKDLISQLDQGKKVLVPVNSKEYGVLKKKKEKVGHMVSVQSYDKKTDSFIVNDSLMDKQISVKRDAFERAMSSAKNGKGMMVSVSSKNSSNQAIASLNESEKQASINSSDDQVVASTSSIQVSSNNKEPISGSSGDEPSKIDNTSTSLNEKKNKPNSPGDIYPGSGYENSWTYDPKTSEVIAKK